MEIIRGSLNSVNSEHGLKFNTFSISNCMQNMLLHYFLISGIIVMMDIRECFVKTDVPIQHLEVNAVKDATAASSFVIIQMDVVLQVKKCGNRNEQGHHFHRHKTSFTKIRISCGVGGGYIFLLTHIYMIFILCIQLLTIIYSILKLGNSILFKTHFLQFLGIYQFTK